MLQRLDLVWSSFVALLCVYNALEAPLHFVFKLDYNAGNLLVNNIISALFILDIYLSFRWHKARFKDEAEHLDNKKKKKLSYFNTPWFPLEVLSAFPYEYIAIFTGMRWVILFKLIRVSLLFKTFVVFKHLHLPKTFRLTVILSMVTIVIHLIACTWLSLYPTPDLSYFGSYTRALYWAITTLTTTGFGDITPTTDAGKIFTIFVMLVGFSAFGLLVGQVSNLIMSKNRKLEENRQKMDDLTSFLNHYEIPKKIRGEVFEFYQHLLNKRLSENDTKIISELPHSLQNEVQIYIKIKLISELPVFFNLSHECLKEVALKLESVFFASGDYVIKKGDQGNEMFIIDHGDVEVLGANGVRLAALGHGQCFGEIALLTETTRTADVKASSYCDLFKLQKDTFKELCKKHPELLENFERIMKRRAQDSKR